jgi:hypothetical protein
MTRQFNISLPKFPTATAVLVWMLLLLPFVGIAQVTYTWIGPNNGSWTTASNWSPTRSSVATSDILQFTSGQTLTITGVPTQAIGRLSVTNGSRITLSSTVTNQEFTINNGTGLDLLVDANSTLTLVGTSRLRITLAANATAEINGELILGNLGNINIPNTGSLFTVNGRLTNINGSFTSTAAARMRFNASSEYNHARNGSSLPLATWNATSTVRFSAITSTTVGSNNQNFGNVIFQSPAQTVNMTFSPVSIAGNLIIANGTSTGRIDQGVNNLAIGGDFELSGGTYTLGNANNANRTLAVAGDFSITGGSLLMSVNSNAIGNLNVAGDFSHTAGTINETSSGSGRITFNGNGSQTQTFTSGGSVTNTINYTIASGAVVQAADANTAFLGGGTFTLSAGATLGIRSPQGITTSGGTGLVRVTGTRTYNTAANYIFNGNTNQTVGNGLPVTVNNLTVANSGAEGSNVVSLAQNTSITGNLSISDGTFDISTFLANRSIFGGQILMADGASLRIGGTNTFPANFQTHSMSCDATVAYTGTNQSIADLNSGANYGNIILSGSGTKTFQGGTTSICGDLALSGTVTAVAGNDLSIGGEFSLGPDAVFQTQEFTLQAEAWNLEGQLQSAGSRVVINSLAPLNIPGGEFRELVVQGSGLKTFSAPATVTEGFVVDSPIELLDGSSLLLASNALMQVPANVSVTTSGSAKIILQPSARYLNLSASNPTLEVRQEFNGSRGWRMMGTPVGSTYADLLSSVESQGFPGSTNPTLQPNVLWFDETDNGTSLQGWRSPAQIADVVPTGRGHYLFVFDGAQKPGGGNYSDLLPLTTDVTGTEPNLNTGQFNFGVTFTPRNTQLVQNGNDYAEVSLADEGFNLLANPTASFIDFFSPSGWTKTNIDNTIYVWDPETNAFLTHNGVLGTLENGRIAPYQAFWVKANGSNPVLQLTNNDAKTSISKEFFGRKKEEDPFAIRLRVNGETMQAASYISFGRGGVEGPDAYDAYQLESLGNDWLFLYSYSSLRADMPLVINHLPELGDEDRIIPLHLAASKGGKPVSGDYLLSWELPLGWPSEKTVTLMDHIHEKAVNMQEESVYAFSFQGPERPAKKSRMGLDSFAMPKNVVFQSPFATGDAAARKSTSSLHRPFTIYIGKALEGESQEYLPDLPKLFAPYPNPFRNEASIKFFVPETTSVEINIYDLMGKVAASFPAKTYPTGTHEIKWSAEENFLRSGLYVVSMTAGNYRFTQKLIKS